MRRSVMTAILATCLSTGAAAQPAEQPRISVGAGGGMANPLHGDFQFTAPTWHVSFRAHPAKLLALEFVYSEWRHTEKSVHTNLPAQGLSGPIGRIGRFEETTERVATSAGINILVRYAPGRVAFWGGGGPGYMNLAREYRQVLSDCEGAVSCNSYSNNYSAGGFAALGAAGLDVGITRRVAGYGQFAFALPVDDPGSGHVSFTGGIRFVLW